MGHVIADAAYDADPLRAFITDELGAAAQIKANPSRTMSRTSTGGCTGSVIKSSASSTSSSGSAHRPALRENTSSLHGLCAPCLRYDLVALNADRP